MTETSLTDGIFVQTVVASVRVDAASPLTSEGISTFIDICH